jgi:hypothetical protein
VQSTGMPVGAQLGTMQLTAVAHEAAVAPAAAAHTADKPVPSPTMGSKAAHLLVASS